MIKLTIKATVYNFTAGSIYTKFLFILIDLIKIVNDELNETAFLKMTIKEKLDSQLTFTCSQSTIERLEKCVKYVQS